jgi:1-deoxy-D-xylulose 5-phosphate reductoisomerase
VAGKNVALANKESMVLAGSFSALRLERVNNPNRQEHSALDQCLRSVSVVKFND